MLHNQTVHAPDPTNHSSVSVRNKRCPLWIALDLRGGLNFPHLTPPIILPLQREAWSALSEVHWIYGTVIPPTRPIIIPLQRETRGALSEVHWFYGTPCQYLLLTTFPERTIPLEIPPTPQTTNKETPIFPLRLEYVITISQQIYTHDFPGKKWWIHTIRNFIPVVTENLNSPTTIHDFPERTINSASFRFHFTCIRKRYIVRSIH